LSLHTRTRTEDWTPVCEQQQAYGPFAILWEPV